MSRHGPLGDEFGRPGEGDLMAQLAEEGEQRVPGPSGTLCITPL